MKQNFYEQKRFRLLTKRMLLLLLSFIFMSAIYAQEKTVTGNISDNAGIPLPGVNVVIKGTTTGAVTDLNGNFALKVPDNNTVLSITYVGYINQEITVGEQTNIKIVLLESVKEIDQIVVIGYGVQKKSDLTGAVASISAKEIVSTPSTRIEEALEGRAAGVNVTSATGMPGGSINMQIRGVSSINGFNPLVVVDGIPQPPPDPTSTNNSIMNRLSSSDIESVEVLKDAASAAIYGSTGGNGVILITTKKGKVGKVATSVNIYTGIQNIDKTLPLMNTRQWNQFYTALNGIPFIYSEDSLNLNYDWQKELYRTAFLNNCEINIAGGSEKSQFSISADYQKQDGIVKNTGYQKMLFSINSVHNLTKHIKLDESARFSNDKTSGPPEWSYQNVYNNFTTYYALFMEPFLSPYDANGKWSISPNQAISPFTGVDERSNQTIKNMNVEGNVGLNIEFLKGLTYTTRISGNSGINENWSFLPYYDSWSKDQNLLPTNTQTWDRSYSWTYQNYATFNKTLFEKHNISVMAGMEAAEWGDHNIYGKRIRYISSNPDLIFFDNSVDDTTASQIVGGSGKMARSQAYFGRINYEFNNMILGQLNIRRDGESNFGPNYKWGTFKSGSVGFKFSELQAVKDMNIFSFGKVRVGVGQSGQYPVSSYWPYASSVLNTAVMDYAFNGRSTSVGQGTVQVPNPDLHWETVTTTNIGADLGFLKDQLNISLDYFIKNNNGMIMSKQVNSVAGTWVVQQGHPAEVGNTGITSTFPYVNFGSVKNKGFEVSVDYKKSFGDFKFNANVNFTYVANKITDLAADSTVQGAVHDLLGITINKIGYSIGEYNTFTFTDIFRDGDAKVYNRKAKKYVFSDQPFSVNTAGDTTYARPSAKPGDAKFADLNHDGAIDPEDRTYQGSYIPPYVFGFTLGFEYKGIDFSAFFQGVYGNKIFNGIKRFTYSWETSTNHSADFADRYHLPVVYKGVTIDPGNTSSNIPDQGSQNWGVPSTLYLEDGSYLRFRNLTVGYTLPGNLTSKVGIEKFRLYFTAKNLFTLTKYKGYDPEISNSDPKLAGIDISGYPQSRMYTFGVNINF